MEIYKFKLIEQLKISTRHKQSIEALNRHNDGLNKLWEQTKKSVTFGNGEFTFSDKQFIELFSGNNKTKQLIESSFLMKLKTGYCYDKGFSDGKKQVDSGYNTYCWRPEIIEEILGQIPREDKLRKLGAFTKKNTILRQLSTFANAHQENSSEKGKSALFIEFNGIIPEIRNKADLTKIDEKYSIKAERPEEPLLSKYRFPELLNITNSLSAGDRNPIELYFDICNKKKRLLDLKYTPDDNGRIHHMIQHINKTMKSEIFAGCWDYDIEASAPTILYQMSDRYAKTKLIHIPHYCSNKTELRQYWADKLGCTTDIVKKIITSMFFGSIISSESQLYSRGTNHIKWTIKKLLTRDQIRILLNDEYFINLRNETKFAMKGIAELARTDKSRIVTNAVGIQKEFKPWNYRKVCYHLYVGVEKLILNNITDRLNSETPPLLLMHDGFISPIRLNTNALEEAVKSDTGYVIKYSEKLI